MLTFQLFVGAIDFHLSMPSLWSAASCSPDSFVYDFSLLSSPVLLCSCSLVDPVGHVLHRDVEYMTGPDIFTQAGTSFSLCCMQQLSLFSFWNTPVPSILPLTVGYLDSHWYVQPMSLMVSRDHLDGVQISWALVRQPEYVVSSSSLHSVCSVFCKFEIKTLISKS